MWAGQNYPTHRSVFLSPPDSAPRQQKHVPSSFICQGPEDSHRYNGCQLEDIFSEEEAYDWCLEQKNKERKSDSNSVDVDRAPTGRGSMFGLPSLSPPVHPSW